MPTEASACRKLEIKTQDDLTYELFIYYTTIWTKGYFFSQRFGWLDLNMFPHYFVVKVAQNGNSSSSFKVLYLQSTQGQRYRKRGCFSTKVKLMAPHLQQSVEVMLRNAACKLQAAIKLCVGVQITGH